MTNNWNIYAKFYDNFIGNKEKDENMTNYIAEHLKNTDILYDGACGTGIFSIKLSKYVKQVQACDLSKQMIKITQEKITKNNIQNIETHIQDITKIEFPDNTFDVAITPNIIHLLEKPEKALNELKRIVKPEGTIIIPTYISQKEDKIEKVTQVLFSIIGFKPNSWTQEEYIKILKNNNMNIIDYKTFKLKIEECVVIIKNDK